MLYVDLMDWQRTGLGKKFEMDKIRKLILLRFLTDLKIIMAHYQDNELISVSELVKHFEVVEKRKK